jgi:hypothetical protein
VKRAVLHDHAERAAVLQNRDVGQRIAVHEEEICEGPRLHDAQLVGPAHQLAPQPRRGMSVSMAEKPRILTKIQRSRAYVPCGVAGKP